MSTGFVLNIPQEMINRLDVADQKIEKLAKTSEDAQVRIVSAFKSMSTNGVDAFIQRLDVAQQKLAQLGGTQINMGVNANTSGLQQLIDAINKLSQASKTNITINGLGTVGNQTQTAIDAINKLMATLQQLQQMGGNQFLGGVNNLGRQTLREMNREAKKMQKTMQDLDDAIQKYGMSATDLANKLQQARQAQQQFNDAAKQQAQADVSGLIGMQGQQTTLNELKNYANELKRTMANLDPKSQEWKKLNDIYKQTNREIKNIQNSMKGVQKQSRGLMDISGQLARKIALVFSVSQITGYVKKLIEVRGEFELQQRSLQAILQNKDEANKIWQQTVDLAVKSPFRVKELVSYTKQLAAYRIESDKLFETNKMLADISAGLGVDMQRLILAFGQVRSAAYLRGTELRQFTEAGIPILEQLAQYFTELEGRAVSVGDVFERVSKRMVSFADVEEIFKRMTVEGGTFYRMQEIQAKTLKGMWSNLKDSIDLMLNEIGKTNEEKLKGSIQSIKVLVDGWRDLAFAIKLVLVPLGTYLTITSGIRFANNAFSQGLLMMAMNTKKTSEWLLKAEKKIVGIASKLGLGKTAAAGFAKTIGGIASLGVAGILAGITVGLVALITKLTSASRAAKKLQKDLEGIFVEDTTQVNDSIDRYGNLIARLREINHGSKERRDIISKLNNEYGQYLDFVITEQTSIDELIDSYDILIKRMKEKASFNTYEKGAQAISDSYGKALKDAKDEFFELFEGGSVRMRGNDLGAAFKTIIPTKEEIEDIYSLLEQKIHSLSADQMDELSEQQKLIQSIVAGYYGKEYFLSRDYAKSIELIDILVDKKKAEEELQKNINAQYKTTLNSRKANLEYDRLELEYKLAQNEIRATKNLSDFDVQKRLDKLREEFELNKIEIMFKFGEISEREKEKLRSSILNWATETTKDINDEIRRNLSDFMSEEEWSKFLITPDKQAKSMSEIIKEITNGYQQQVDIINQQISLKSAGREVDEKGLEFAEKQKKAYEAVASILGVELKAHEQISEELRKQINDLMPKDQQITLEDSYKSIKTLQEETDKSYKEQLATLETLINQKRAGVAIDRNALDVAYEDLKILQEKKKLLGMKVDEPMSDTTRHSINYSLPEEFKISEADALKGVSAINKEASAAFEKAQKELQILLDMQDEEVEGIEDQISLLNQQLPYLQKKVELTGTQLKDRLTEQQLNEINGQLEQQHHLQEINLYKERGTVISEIQEKAKEIEGNILTMEEMRKEGLTIDDAKLKKLEEEYLINKKILNLIDHTQEKAIDTQKVNDINAKLQSKYRIGVIDSQKSEITLLKEAEQARDKAIAYEAQLNRMKAQGVTITAQELALAKEEVAQYTLKANLLGAEVPKVSTSSRKGNLYEERIRVIDDMNKKYQELAKTLPEVEARQGAFNAYIDAFASAYKGIAWIPSNVRQMSADEFIAKVLNFPNEDKIVAFLDKLEKNAKKKADKIKVELAKGQYVLDMRVRVQKESDKELFKDIQDMFDKYELSLELKKLNITPELAKSLFNLDTQTLDELKRGVTDAFMGIENYEEQVKNAAKIMKEAFNGNVDLLNRKLIPAQELVNKGWKDVGDGIATVFSSQHGIKDAKGNKVEILVTPILPDGTVMSESELESYIKNTLSGAEDILKADTKGIVIHAGLEMDSNMGEALHTLQEVFYASEMLSKDQKEKYADFLAKIAQMDKKAALERMKTYSKYLLEGMSERVKLKIEEMRKLKEVEESEKFKPDQKKRIKEGISQEAKEAQQSQEWKDFKDTDMYTMIFEDIEHYGNAAIDALYTKLSELKKSLSELPANEVKEIVSQIEKLENIKIERNPFQELAKYRKEVKNIGFSEEELQGQLRGLQEREAYAQRIIDVIHLMEQASSDNISQADALAQLSPEQLDAWRVALGLQKQLGGEMSTVVQNQEKIVKKSKEGQTIVVGQLSSYKKLSKSQQEAYKRTEEWLNAVGDVFSASKELMTALGVESDSVAMTIADTGSSMVSLILSAVQFTAQLQVMGVTANLALGIIGWIAIALQAVATLLTAIFSAKDNQLKKQVEAHQRTVENLLESYEELEKKIDEAWSVEAIRQYNAEMKNTMSLAIEAKKAAIAAQEQRKRANKEGTEEHKELQDMKAELDEMEQQLEDSLKESFSKITDGILDDVFDVAKEFTDAWYEAFKETGDGLSGLEEDFNEMFMNLAKNQAAGQITGHFVKEWKRDLQKYLNDTDTRLTPEEAALWAEDVKATMPELSAALEAFLGTIHEGLDMGSGELSALQKGTQGMTADQAEILTAYWNSVRGYTASIDSKMDLVLANLGAGTEENPMLEQMRLVAKHTSAINTLLNSLVKGGHPQGGQGLKVFMD